MGRECGRLNLCGAALGHIVPEQQPRRQQSVGFTLGQGQRFRRAALVDAMPESVVIGDMAREVAVAGVFVLGYWAGLIHNSRQDA